VSAFVPRDVEAEMKRELARQIIDEKIASGELVVSERNGGLIKAEEYDKARHGPMRKPLPVVLGGGPDFACSRCGSGFRPATWHVERGNRPACRQCALADPETAVWQLLCDVADHIDQLMQQASDQQQRNLLAQMVAHRADHFSVWRWPEEQP
jgi:hypothetical protein